MAKLVKSQPIENVFLHTERTAGTDKNFQQLVDRVQIWQHFFINLPPAYVAKGADIGPTLSETRATHDVLLRSLTEITRDAVDTVLELIAQNSLYRGEEQKFAVEEFKKLKEALDGTLGENKDALLWTQIKTIPQSVSRIRNTAVGTLLVDLSEGKGLESAVGSFEAKVAPTNYKRPTALITKSMIEQARKKIDELNLTSALDRRYATITDITVNNVLFADRASRHAMKGDVFSELAAQAPAVVKKLDKIEEVPVEKFITDVLPRAESVEIMFESGHAGNLMSLIAPADPTALFKRGDNHAKLPTTQDRSDPNSTLDTNGAHHRDAVGILFRATRAGRRVTQSRNAPRNRAARQHAKNSLSHCPRRSRLSPNCRDRSQAARPISIL